MSKAGIPPSHGTHFLSAKSSIINLKIGHHLIWSGQRDLNPRPSRWQRDALPLSYARIFINYYRTWFLLSKNN